MKGQYSPTSKITFAVIALILVGFFYTLLPPTPNSSGGAFNATYGSVNVSSIGTSKTVWGSWDPVGAASQSFSSISNLLVSPDAMTANAALPDLLTVLIVLVLSVIIGLGILDYIHGVV